VFTFIAANVTGYKHNLQRFLDFTLTKNSKLYMIIFKLTVTNGHVA
jgi:hypothetical protein